jgi:hypothetical protein
MQRYRFIVRLFWGVLCFFLAANFVIWKLWTKDLISPGYAGGDLARLGYFYDARLPRRDLLDLPRRHLEFKEYNGQPIDVVTIGDSFSQGGGGGRNRYYQDYIASFGDMTVLNICLEANQAPAVTLVKLINNGILKQIRPRYVILEVSERACWSQLGMLLDFSVSEPVDSFAAKARKDYFTMVPPRLYPINNGNIKFVKYSIMYNFTDNPSGKVYVKRLNQELFSSRGADRLLFLRDDLDGVFHQRLPEITEVNRNLEQLAKMLARDGIRLVFMPVVDKSNLYRDYLRDDSFPRSIFFEEFRKLPKQYSWIDTKALLTPELARGEKDLFYPDDSHWSWKASKRIFEAVPFDRENH